MPSRLIQAALVVVVLAALVSLASFFQAAEQPQNHVELWFFDVGQGDAILFNTDKGEQILIDGGPDQSILRHLSEVMPLHDKTIELMIVTHNHADHITGLIEVAEHYTVRQAIISGAIHTTDRYRRLIETLTKKQIPTKTVKAGERFQFEQLTGLVIYPLDSVVGVLPENQNSLSLVTYWQVGPTTVLLTGDIEVEQELTLVRRGLLKPSTILKVSHQGSQTSTSQAFLEATKPKYAVISVGADNRYGHPHRSVVERLERFNIPILRTDRLGTVMFRLYPDRYELATAR